LLRTSPAVADCLQVAIGNRAKDWWQHSRRHRSP